MTALSRQERGFSPSMIASWTFSLAIEPEILGEFFAQVPFVRGINRVSKPPRKAMAR
jgi:hypothetical protein